MEYGNAVCSEKELSLNICFTISPHYSVIKELTIFQFKFESLTNALGIST